VSLNVVKFETNKKTCCGNGWAWNATLDTIPYIQYLHKRKSFFDISVSRIFIRTLSSRKY